MLPDTATLSTRETLLAAAADLLQRVGYASFSFRDLAAAVGIRSASVHYHFPSKADLGLALVDWFRAQTLERERALCDAYPDVRARLLALFEHLSTTCTEGKSCPLNSLQAEFAVLPERLQAAVTTLVDEKVSILARWLEAGRSTGELRFPGAASTQALLVWSVIEYGSQHARSHPDRSLTALARQLIALMSPSP